MKAYHREFIVDAAFKDGLSEAQILRQLHANGAPDARPAMIRSIIARHRKKYFTGQRKGLRLLGKKVVLLNGDSVKAVAITSRSITVLLKDGGKAKLDLSAVSYKGRSLDSWAKELNYRLY